MSNEEAVPNISDRSWRTALPDRRTFQWQLSSSALALIAGSANGDEEALVRESVPPARRMVALGLSALARAHSMSYFADGHRGAALVSAHLLCEENHLSNEAHARIEQLFELNWANSPLCQPFPNEDGDVSLVGKIGEALMEANGQLREVGHNAIFAMLAIRGFRLMPEFATPRRIEGVCKLIRAIKPWRDEVPISEEVNPPPFKDGAAASAFVLKEASRAIDQWAGRGQGFSGHMLTFGQALIELAEMGDVEWAESCRKAFRKYVTITRNGPTDGDRVIVEHKRSDLRPNSTEYWQKRGDKQVDIGHVFKYPYSYYDLLRRANDETLAQEFDAKAWRLF
jgi:hypothetical protein